MNMAGANIQYTETAKADGKHKYFSGRGHSKATGFVRNAHVGIGKPLIFYRKETQTNLQGYFEKEHHFSLDKGRCVQVMGWILPLKVDEKLPGLKPKANPITALPWADLKIKVGPGKLSQSINMFEGMKGISIPLGKASLSFRFPESRFEKDLLKENDNYDVVAIIMIGADGKTTEIVTNVKSEYIQLAGGTPATVWGINGPIKNTGGTNNLGKKVIGLKQYKTTEEWDEVNGTSFRKNGLTNAKGSIKDEIKGKFLGTYYKEWGK